MFTGDFNSPILYFNNGKTLSGDYEPNVHHAYIAKYTQNPEDVISELSDSSIDISPNPAKTYVDVEINLTDATEATLSIYDLNGKVVLTAYNVMLKQGSNSLQINCQALPNGTYNVILQTGSRKLTKRFVVER